MIRPYRLHYAPDNASLVVRLALEELGAPYETCFVDRASSAEKSAGYLALNPAGLVPALETDTGVIFETAAILLWLVDRHEALGPSPASPDRGRFLSWLFFVSNTLHPALRMSFYPWCYVGDDDGHKAQLAEVAADELVRFFDMLETEAGASHGSLGGASPTVLDFYVAACLRWIQLYPDASPHRHRFASRNWPDLHALLLRLETRPSVGAFCRAERIKSAPFTAPDYPAVL